MIRITRKHIFDKDATNGENRIRSHQVCQSNRHQNECCNFTECSVGCPSIHQFSIVEERGCHVTSQAGSKAKNKNKNRNKIRKQA
jgi:hypothetical protein